LDSSPTKKLTVVVAGGLFKDQTGRLVRLLPDRIVISGPADVAEMPALLIVESVLTMAASWAATVVGVSDPVTRYVVSVTGEPARALDVATNVSWSPAATDSPTVAVERKATGTGGTAGHWRPVGSPSSGTA
jgi:hypothetical protein